MNLRNINYLRTIVPAIQPQEGNVNYSICNLGQPILTTLIYEYMINNNVLLAAQLSLTCKTWYVLFEQALADKLLQVLVDASVFSKDVEKHFSFIIEMLRTRPSVVFTPAQARKPNGTMVEASPASYAFASGDCYFQGLISENVTRINKLGLFAQIGKNTPRNVSLDHEYEMYSEVITTLEADTNDLIDRHELYKSKIIPLFATMPRWIIDRMLDLDGEWHKDANFTECAPPRKYQVFGSGSIFLKYEGSQDLTKTVECDQFGKKFGLSRTFYGDDMSEPFITDMCDLGSLTNDWEVICGLFNKRAELQEIIVEILRGDSEEMLALNSDAPSASTISASMC